MPSALLYLDNNATTPLDDDVAEAMRACATEAFANPSSQHAAGRRARRLLEDARDGIAALLGVETAGRRADRVIFTSGGTEANNLALFGLGKAGDVRREAGEREERNPDLPPASSFKPQAFLKPHASLIVSSAEHPSVSAAAERRAARDRWGLRRLPLDENGVTPVDTLVAALDETTRLASVVLASGETGVVQPVAKIANACRPRGIVVHTDASQAVGKIGVDFRSLGVDAMTVAAHKFHGPRGIGALVIRHGVEIDPILHGGFQQQGFRPGTEPVALVVGMRRALEIWQGRREEIVAHLRGLRDRFERVILAGWPEAVAIGASADRLPQTSNIAFPGCDRQALAMAFDLAGVACSTGSACASGSSEPSPTLLAMRLAEPVVRGSIRFSFGRQNTADDADEAARRILLTLNDLRRKKNGGKSPATPPAGAAAGV